MSELATVKVRSGDSFATINEEDYDEKIHGKKLPDDYEDPKPGEKGVKTDTESETDETNEELTVDGLVKKNTKHELLEMAAEKGVEIAVPDDLKKTQIAELIVAAAEAEDDEAEDDE